MEKVNNNSEAEKTEIEAIVDRGFEFSVPTKGIIERLLYGKRRRFKLHEPTTGALDLMAKELLEIRIDEDRLAQNPIGESNRMVNRYSAPMVRIIAILVLNERCVKVVGYANDKPIFSRPDQRKIDRLAGYFLWKLKPSTLLEVAKAVRVMMNIGPFVKSTGLMSAELPRTTKPQADPVEGDM